MANPTTTNGRPAAGRRDQPMSRNSSNTPYRVLLGSLQSLGYGSGSMKTLGLTSSNRREGVTTVAINLALYAASCHDLRVVIVDANFSNPGLHQIFELEKSPGLSDLMNEHAIGSECIHDMSTLPIKTWPQVLRRCFRPTGLSRFVGRNWESLKTPQLSIIPVGTDRESPNIFHERNDNGYLEEFCDESDLVIVDLPAVSLAADVALSVSSLDGVLVVLEAERTSDLVAQNSLRQIKNDGGNVLGVALNKCRTHLPGWIDAKLGT